MLKTSKTLFILLNFIIFVFTSCSRQGELQGTVFIVTKGADNIKLGLVKITAIPESEITQFIENKKSVINKESNKFKSDADQIKPEIERNQKVFDEAKKNYDGIIAQRDSLKSKEESLNSGFNEFALYEDPYLSEYESPEQKAERYKQQQLKKQIDALRKQIAAFEPKVTQANKIMTEAGQRLTVSKAKLGEITDKIKGFVKESFLLDGLPDGKNKAITDADGKFTMKLPTGKYALVASSQRRVFDSTEEYYWLIWVNSESKEPQQIILSNQNLMGTDSEDSVFKYNELIPAFASPSKESNPNKLNA